MAGQNFKVTIRLARQLADKHLGNLCKRRSPLGKVHEEVLDQAGLALNFDGDSCWRVADVSDEAPVLGEPIDVRAEPDSLYDPGDLDLLADLHEV